MLDTQRLIAEIAERHNVRVEPDDPVFIVVTVNQRVMEDTVREMLKAMEATLARFDASVERAENRARFHYSLLAGLSSRAKVPFAILRRQWWAVPDTLVVVVVYFQA